MSKLITLCVVLIVARAPTDATGGLMYQFKEFTGFDPGWSFDGGFLEIQDGFVGDLSTANTLAPGTPNSVIEDWSIAFKSPMTTITLTPTNSVVSYADVLFAPNFHVGPMEITHPLGVDTGSDTLRFFKADGNQSVEFTRGVMTLGDLAAMSQITTPPPYTVAVVPEPVIFMQLGIVGLLLASRRRRSAGSWVKSTLSQTTVA